MKLKTFHFAIGIMVYFTLSSGHLTAGIIVPSYVPARDEGQPSVSFKRDVFPVIEKHCLPCHSEESVNSSELSLDSYRLLMEGGEHGPAVVRGKPEESPLIQKLSEKPPFGDTMPVARRRRSQTPPKRLTEEEVRILSEWIKQGAKEN